MTATIADTRVKVKHLIGLMRTQALSPQELAEALEGVSLAQVYSALAYYEDHKNELDETLAQDVEAEGRAREASDQGDLKARLRTRAAY